MAIVELSAPRGPCKFCQKYREPTPPPVYVPCRWEGAIVEFYTCCGGKEDKDKHVRLCGHPSGEIDKCTRNNPKSSQRQCVGCNYHEIEPEAEPVTVAEALASSGSDKHRVHGYGPMYSTLTAGRRIRSILEIGILRGDSIRAWAAAWPDAEIIAADADPQAASSIADIPAARFVRLDVGDGPALREFAARNRNRFDLIVDDSTHKAGHQVAIRRILYQCLRPGGVMVIEDLANETAVRALRGRVWDFRRRHQWDSRAVSIERPKSRRVLFCSHYLERDGAPILFANLARHLRDWSVEVHSPIDGPLRGDLERSGIPVHVGDLSHRIFAGMDLVVANTLVASAAVERTKECGLPCVWLIHESDPEMCGPAIEEHVRGLIDYPARVVYPCKATADAYREFPPHRAEVIPTVIPPMPVRNWGREDAKRYAAASFPRHIFEQIMAFRIVTFGRDEKRKGQQDIRAAIEGMDGVQLHAAHDENDPHHHLQNADLYVCSSRIEAFPLSIQEAKAYGVPVITTPVFGCSEIIRDGIDGLHYQPGDVADLREKIERVRTDPDLRSRLSRPLTHLPSYPETLRKYESLFAGAAGLPDRDQPLHVVYHVAGMGPWWKSIVREQLVDLARVGLQRIHATHVGEGETWLLDEAARQGLDLVLCEHHADVRQWECPAIRLVERLAQNDDRPILYLHSKGVSHDPKSEPVYHEWRRLMMRELVERWFEHLPLLDSHDAIGVNWWTKRPHFSGNFWLATAAWIRRLPRFDTYFRDRYSCERWIGAIPGCRARSLACTNKRLWDQDRELLESLVSTW